MNGWRRPPSPGEWLAVALLVAGVAVALAVREAAPAALLPNLAVETRADGRAVARLSDPAWREAWSRTGLREPASLEGADPAPVRALLEQVDRWNATREPDALGRIGRIFVALEEHRAALDCFAALAELEPGNPEWAYMLGVEAQALGLVDLAVEELARAASAEPGYATTHARLGLLHLERGDLEAAERAYGRLVALRPGWASGHVGLGRVALQRDAPAEAEEHLRRAVEASPGDFMAHRYLGQALSRVGRHDEAVRESRIAEELPHYVGWLSFDPRLQEAHAQAGTQRHLENEIRRARSAGDAAAIVSHGEPLVARRPNDYNTLAILAEGYLALERVDDARDAIARAVELKPDSVPLRLVQAKVAMRTRDLATGHAATDAALSSDPRSAQAHEVRARLLFLERRMEEARAAIERALEIDPDAAPARFVHAMILERLGRTAEARAALEELLRRDPGNAEARARLARLEGAVSP